MNVLTNFLAVIGGTSCVAVFLFGLMVLSALGEEDEEI